jgi:hypothetical protein
MVMFDFFDETKPEYKQHSLHVDTLTNRPRSIKDLDKTKLTYPYVQKPETQQIFVKEHFLSPDECDYFVWLAETADVWSEMNEYPFWHERNLSIFRYLPYHKYASVETIRLVLSVHQKIKEFVSKSFGVEVFADQIGIFRWPPGSYQMPHIDEQEGYSRVAGCVVYLNEDYKGGETYYPYHDRSLAPREGAIFAHSANASHLHGVTKILEKTRYTIGSTWSTQKEHSTYEAELSKMKSYLESQGQQELPVDKKC